MKATGKLFLIVLMLCALSQIACGDDVNDSNTDTDTNPVDTNPVDTTPLDTNPADTNPADTNPADTSSDTTPGDTNTTPVDTATDTTTDTAVDTATDSDTIVDTNPPTELVIEAECLFEGANADDEMKCFSAPEGSYSAIPKPESWSGPDTMPSLSSSLISVGYTGGGSWVAYNGINLSHYSKITMRYSCGDEKAQPQDTDDTVNIGYLVKLDSETADTIEIIKTSYTGDYNDTFAEVTIDIPADSTGKHNVYFVANLEDVNNGNIDWIKFHN